MGGHSARAAVEVSGDGETANGVCGDGGRRREKRCRGSRGEEEREEAKDYGPFIIGSQVQVGTSGRQRVLLESEQPPQQQQPQQQQKQQPQQRKASRWRKRGGVERGGVGSGPWAGCSRWGSCAQLLVAWWMGRGGGCDGRKESRCPGPSLLSLSLSLSLPVGR
jgi:hypothetical protein